ncbi:MAG TPA: DUF882 domain-containing protein [Caulobacteraceae bacterium]|nr:DUF882 domain-containing protein [Caulobacteraceae bacterium]
MLVQRRALIGGGAFALASLALGAGATAATQPRRLALLNLHTGERLSATYWESGTYVDGALDAFSHLLRDHRTSEVHAIAPGVFDILSALQSAVDSSATFDVISGYRSPQTNARLHEASSGVAAHSLHMEGKAIDIRLPGTQLAGLRDAAIRLQRGGVGFYPKDDFVHVDVGRVRRW